METESITRRTLSGFFWMFSSAGMNIVLRMMILAVLARLLTPSEFGLVGVAWVVVGFSGIFSFLGVGPAIVQRSDLEARHLRTGFTISVLFGLLLAMFIWLLAPITAAFFRMKELISVLRLLGLFLPLSGLSVVAISLLQRDLRFRELAWIQVASYAAGYGLVGISLAFMGFGVWALVGANLAESLLSSTILLITQPHPKQPQIDRRAFKELMFFGGGLTAGNICNYFALQGDRLVVGRWLGAYSLGLYGRAYGLIAISTELFGKVLDRVLFPAMAKLQSQPEYLAAAYRRGSALVAIVALPSSATLCVLAPEVISVLLGPEWSKVIVPFQIFTIGVLFRVSFKVSGALVRAVGAVYGFAWRQAVYAVLVVGGALVGQHWGISGVVLGVVGALIFNFILTVQLSLNLTTITWRDFFASHLPAVFLAAIIGGEVWAVVTVLRALDLPSIAVLIISFVVFAMTLLVLLRFCSMFVLGRDGLWILQTVFEYIPEKFILLNRLKRGIRSMPTFM